MGRVVRDSLSSSLPPSGRRSKSSVVPGVLSAAFALFVQAAGCSNRDSCVPAAESCDLAAPSLNPFDATRIVSARRSDSRSCATPPWIGVLGVLARALRARSRRTDGFTSGIGATTTSSRPLAGTLKSRRRHRVTGYLPTRCSPTGRWPSANKHRAHRPVPALRSRGWETLPAMRGQRRPLPSKPLTACEYASGRAR